MAFNGQEFTNLMIYLDYNSTAQILPSVLKNISHQGFLNPSSVHFEGKKAKKLYTNAKEDILQSLNANGYNIIFCSSGTEANNLALFGKSTACTFVEHESVKNQPYVIENITVDGNGLVNLQSFIKSSQNFECLSVIWANNFTGVVQNAEELNQNKGKAFLHMDAVQIAGKQKIDLQKTSIDAITIAGHKIGAGHGCGILVYRKNFPINKIIFGGGQEGEVRAGTQNLPAILAMAQALKTVNSQKYLEDYQNHTKKLRQFICNFVENNSGQVISQNQNGLENTLCIAKSGVPATEQLLIFDVNKICVSGGSACSAGVVGKSHVLYAMGLKHLAPFAIRVSLGMQTTMAEAEKFCTVWKNL